MSLQVEDQGCFRIYNLREAVGAQAKHKAVSKHREVSQQKQVGIGTLPKEAQG